MPAEAGVELVVKHRGLVTVCLMIATLMQALDSTIANVALPYMQGSLSASYDEVTWVLTSYVVMAAIMTAPVGWLAMRFGRKNLFILALAGFTFTSILCGIAGSLTQMVLYRLAQGAFGAALVPLSQSTLMDMYPPEKRGAAMAIWGMGVMIGPIMGPTLGGYLTAAFDWRYVFFVNLPFGILGVLGLLVFLPRTPPSPEARFDWSGFLLLSGALAALQLALDRGEELDWLNSPFIIAGFVLSLLCFYLFAVHMVTSKTSFIPREIFKDRNFVAGLVTMFSVGIILVASSALLSPFLESLSNYPVATAGMLMAPRGIGILITMQIAGRLTNTIDPRKLMAFGYVLLGAALVIQESWTLDTSQLWIVFTITLQGMGLGLIFVPLQVVAFYTMSGYLRTQGAGLLALQRNIGSAIGISLTSALLAHMGQYEHAVLATYITPFARPLQVGGAVSHFLNPGSPHGAALLDALINTQAQIIAYGDDYKFMLLTTLPGFLCILFMRRPPASPTMAPPLIQE